MIRKTPLLIAALALVAGFLAAEIFYPWKDTYIGSLDAAGWPGLVIAPTTDRAYAFLLRVEREGESAEGMDFYYLVSEAGPHSPDGLYARARFDLGLPFKMGRSTPVLMKPAPRRQSLTFEWSRRDERTVIGRVVAPAGVRVTFVHYFPWDRGGELAPFGEGQVRGRCGPPGGPAVVVWTSLPGETGVAPPGSLARTYLPGDDRTVAFVAGVGESPAVVSDRITRYKNAETIGAFLDEEAVLYEEKRVRARGPYAGVPEAVADSLHWALLYKPGSHRFYAPAGRAVLYPRPDGGRDDWTITVDASFLNLLGLALESQKTALDALASVLETQYPNGNVPGWRGRSAGTADRSQPPLGAYVVLKLFERFGDLEVLRQAYPALQRWHDYWTARRPDGQARRDGNGDGLLEWGSDPGPAAPELPSWERNATGRMKAGRESGQDDLPSWEDASFNEAAGTLAMNCLDLNALYALDAWCLAEMAGVLGRPVDVERYRDEYDRMKALVNARLWNERAGFYYDRHWDGRFSVHKTASAFLPLLAGIPDQDRAQRMVRRLLDPKQFWGDFVVPSISRDDPAFRPESQRSWRGAVRPSLNYLIYQGLKAYGFDAVASELARKGGDMFLRSWRSFGLSPESYDSLTGEAAGERLHAAGPLIALPAVEEFLDFTPHEGFRFGLLKPEAKGRLTRVMVQGRHYEVEASGSATVLREEGETLMSVDGGAVVRRFLYNESEVSFAIKVLKRREVRLRLLKKGKYQLLVDGRETDVFSGSARKFAVPEGDHTVLIQLLEDLDRDGTKGERRP